MMKQVFIFAAALSLTACGPGRPHLKTIELNREGNSSLKGEAAAAAMEKYVEALRYDPFVGQLHLNLGLSLEVQQQADKAILAYKEAEKLALAAQNGPLVFMARFNQGQLLGKAKKVDEALLAYQSALEIIPTSDETKINIELLTQQQQGGGGGEGDKKQDQQQQGQNKQDQKKDGKDKDQDKKDKDEKDSQDKKEFNQSPKYKPRPFQGKELSEADVKKILGELKQQEEKIRAEYNRKETKEQPRDKDW